MEPLKPRHLRRSAKGAGGPAGPAGAGPHCHHCTQFGSSEELLEAFRPGKFDLLLMDIYMDGMTGVEAVQKIREMDDAIPIAFTTTSTSIPWRATGCRC